MRSIRARFPVLAAFVILGVCLVPMPGRPPLAYRALRHFGIIAAEKPKPAVPGERLSLQEPSLSPLPGAPAQLIQKPGHALLIDIFATWCPPCRGEMAELSVLAPQLTRAGLSIAGIDQAESRSQVQAAVHAFGITFPVYIDEGDESWVTAAREIPTIILVDRHGIVRFVHAGPLDRAQLLEVARAI